MRFRRSLGIIGAASLLGALVLASPAVAAPQSGLVATLVVIVNPGSQSGLEEKV